VSIDVFEECRDEKHERIRKGTKIPETARTASSGFDSLFWDTRVWAVQ
jgi:hypothetical protein